MKIPKIVLTGGPCSGKTTSLSYLAEKLSDFGFMVFIVPEAATLAISGGIDPRKMSDVEQIKLFEESLFDIQLYLEKIIEKSALKIFPAAKKVILCDRGIMDLKAYMPEPAEFNFKNLLEKKKRSAVKIRDNYEGVIHLITAAEGATEFYTRENNKARLETPQEAILADQKTRDCWLGHPHLKIIDNSTDFAGKKKRVLAAICGFLRIPAPPGD